MTSASDDSAARPVDPDLTVVATGVGTTGAPSSSPSLPSEAAPAAAPEGSTSPVPTSSSNVLPAGTQLAEFTVTGVIGEGGFGIVYRAHDRSLQRTVAVKEYMPSALASRLADTRVVVKSEQHRETFEIGLKSFINEARLLAQFDHPALVKVFRFWAANGTAYMAMPLYEGGTLRQALKARSTAPDEAWLRKLLVPLLDAIELLHAADCLHRDIAPDNVLMGPGSSADTPRPVLLDFGAARRVIGGQTQALTVILKPGYAPIEQYDEIPGMKQGPWTDLYALGAVMHAAITGKPPPPSVGRLINDSWVPLSQAAAGRYSASFLAAIDAVLSSRPDDRPRNVAQWRAMLAASEASAAAPVSESARAFDTSSAVRTGPQFDARTDVHTDPGSGLRTAARTEGHEVPTRPSASEVVPRSQQPTAPRSIGPRTAPVATTAVPVSSVPPTRWGKAVLFGAIAGLLIVGLLWSAIYWQGVKSDQQLARSSAPAKAVASPKDAPAPELKQTPPPTTPPSAAPTPGTSVGLPLEVKTTPTPSPTPIESPTPALAPSPAVVASPSVAPSPPKVVKKPEPRKRSDPAGPPVTAPVAKPAPATPVETPPSTPAPIVVASVPPWIETALREARACLAAKQYACTIARAESVLKADPNHAGALALRNEGRSAQEQALGSDWKMR